MKCFNIDVRIYSTSSSSFVCFVLFCFIRAFCHVDIDAGMYSTCACLCEDCECDCVGVCA